MAESDMESWSRDFSLHYSHTICLVELRMGPLEFDGGEDQKIDQTRKIWQHKGDQRGITFNFPYQVDFEHLQGLIRRMTRPG